MTNSEKAQVTSNEINDTCEVHDHLMPDGRCSCPTKLGVNRQRNSKIEVCRAAFEKHLGPGAQLNRGRGGYYVASIVERAWQDFSTGWCARDTHETCDALIIEQLRGNLTSIAETSLEVHERVRNLAREAAAYGLPNTQKAKLGDSFPEDGQ
jgi:hypothetical protein